VKQYQTIIIGGGAAGMMAAIVSARRISAQTRQGSPVLLIEKNKMLGRKVLVTGNGRCNLTNTHITPDDYYGENTRCLHSLFEAFSSRDTMDFFEKLGVRLKTEEGGRIFPVTNQASTVVDVMVEELREKKVNVKLEERLVRLSRLEDGWEVKTSKDTYKSDKVVLTVGGKSYPQLGSSGDGYEFCKRLGHTLVEPRPALVPLELEGNWFHKLQGVKFDVELSLRLKNKVIRQETGELLFTHYGISGPIVLDLSRLIMDYRHRQGSSLMIDFFPGYRAEGLAGFLSERWQAHPQKTLSHSLLGLLPQKLCSVLVGDQSRSDIQEGSATIC
jgi:predicted Rossmann fold flavoprotein